MKYLYISGEIGKISAMDEEAEIPTPIRFNPFKHHRNYILGILKGASSELIINLLDPTPIKRLERSKGILNCYEKFFGQD